MIDQETNTFLKDFKSRNNSSEKISSVRNHLSLLKKGFVNLDDQKNAKNIWVYEQFLKAQEQYLTAYNEMKSYKFYQAWCTLEQCELTLLFLSEHFNIQSDNLYSTNFISTHINQYQQLFPYKMFSSPEILEKEKRCTVCGSIVNIRNNCGHKVGEIYNGEMCCREVTSCEILGIAFVSSPVQKYSVPFNVDPKTGNSIDVYNYFSVKYVIDRLYSPFDSWSITKTKKLHPHSFFYNIGRNDPCPCGSKIKYKKCCFIKEGVYLNHMDITFEIEPPAHLQTTVFSFNE